jgi:hypothetical protein
VRAALGERDVLVYNAGAVKFANVDAVATSSPRARRCRTRPLFLKPDDVAASVLHLTRQPKSAWTFELDVRPFSEKR